MGGGGLINFVSTLGLTRELLYIMSLLSAFFVLSVIAPIQACPGEHLSRCRKSTLL